MRGATGAGLVTLGACLRKKTMKGATGMRLETESSALVN